MTIETKYNIGDEVWAKDNANVINGHVINILIDCNFGHHNSIVYVVNENNALYMQTRFLEWQLYPTKEELLKSL